MAKTHSPTEVQMLRPLTLLLLAGACGQGSDEPKDTTPVDSESTDTGTTDTTTPYVDDTSTTDTGADDTSDTAAGDTSDTAAGDTSDTGTGDTGDTDTGSTTGSLFPVGDYPCHGFIDIDHGADGTIDATGFRAFDTDLGVELYYGVDEGSDGTIDLVYRYAYDSDGHQTLTDRDFDGDGISELVWTWTYDVDGELTEFTKLTTTGLWTETYVPGPDGPVEERIDYEGDGIDDVLYVNTYVAGALVRADVDMFADGTFESAVHHEYDADGRPVRIGWVAYASYGGDVLSSITYTYLDANGSYEELSDLDGNGTVEEWHEATLDAEGNVVVERFDRGFDGTIDYDIAMGWHPDGHGMTSFQGLLWGNYGSPYTRIDYDQSWTYDSEGKLLVESDLSTYYGVPEHELATTTWTCP